MIGSLAGAFSFVSANQADPWWLSGGIPAANCIAAYQPKGAASLAASYVNLANPGTYNAAPGVAPTWDAVNGWTFASASLQYLKTGIVNGSGWSMIVKFSGAASVTGQRMIGTTAGASANFYIAPFYINQVLYGAGGVVVSTPNVTSGILAVSGTACYRNGVADGTASAWSGTNTYEIYIGCLNSGAAGNYFSGNIQAVAIYNTSIAAYIVALNSAMAAL
jgi:hypothetical protein